MDMKIALAGNPNCGKTTLFNALTGSSQYVGNWPGVTVEKKEGRLKGHKDVVIQDLPGIYSLSPYTLEEVVARSYLVNERPDAILNIVDGTNMERNLYLTTQLIELGLPVVVAVNMMDLVRKNGDTIDLAKLGNALGCEVVAMSALKGEGGAAAAEKALALAHIEESIQDRVADSYLRWYAIKREMNNGKWTWAAIGYMCGFAYVISLMVYQLGGLLTGTAAFGPWTVVALAALAAIIYLLVRRGYQGEERSRRFSSAAAAK